MLWMCNISNLVLAIGIFFRLPALIRISALWLIPGVPLWLYDMNRTGYDPTTTFFPHIGGTLVGLYALYCVKGRRHMWIYAWVYGLIVQILCRFLTPRELNVNV